MEWGSNVHVLRKWGRSEGFLKAVDQGHGQVLCVPERFSGQWSISTCIEVRNTVLFT